MQHVMLDLETWGTRPGCMLRSIGAVFFDPFGDKLGDELYVNIDGRQPIILRREDATVDWWEAQPAEAQAAFSNPAPVSLDYALSYLTSWWQLLGAFYVWSKPQKFDLPIIEAAFHATHRVEPWHRKNVRDVYTLLWLAGLDEKSIPFDGTPHHALHDAKHQARCVQHAMTLCRLNAVYEPAGPDPEPAGAVAA